MRATGSIQSLMETTLETIKGSIDANTIIGDPIQTETTVVVPISKVTIGFGIGGGEYSKGYDNRNGIEINNEKKIQILQEVVQVLYLYNQWHL